MDLDLPPLLLAALALVTTVVASARLTRLVAQDAFPPVVRFRIWWDAKTEDSPWNPLMHCHWCLAPWVVAAVGGLGFATSWHWAWWVIAGWLSLSYAASWLVHHDEDGG